MRQKRSDAEGLPFCIQPEISVGCSMSKGDGPGGLCAFCGLTAIRNGPGKYEFMTVETATLLANQAAEFCPKVRVEFAMRGEPLMNPKAVEIFSIFRKALPAASMMVTTNGDVLRSTPNSPNRMQERMDKIFDAGINLVLMDTYLPEDRRQELRDQAFRLNNIVVYDFFEDMQGSREQASPYSNSPHRKRTLCLMDDLLARNGEHSSRQVKTHAGANMMSTIGSEFPMKRNCGRPFREITVHANGDVPLCCDDWRAEYIIANIYKMPLNAIWKHPRFEAARARLFSKDRAFGPCAQCDAPMAPRTGLLPVYNSPTEEEIQLTEETFKKKRALWEK